ncbi:MAG: hypothetical protein ACRENP_11150 [Longimicrobiales bacterium]
MTLPSPARADSNRIALGLGRVTMPFAIDLTPTSGPREYFLRQPFTSWVDEWYSSARSHLERQPEVLLRKAWSGALPASPRADAVALAAPAVAARDTAERTSGVLPGRLSQFADIGMVVKGRAELGGAWTKFAPCDPGLHLNCSPSLFPQLKPDMQFGVQVAGTISDRIHVNVDYDQTREFDAANNINVFYQGFADEVLQRVEVGDVSIRLPASRYLTQGIPAGNFGFKATGQLGPLEFQTVFAQQRGDVTTREFRLGGLGNQQGLVQDAQLMLDDADYVEGQFFFLVDPDSLFSATGPRHVDVLALRPGDAPSSLRPARGGQIQVYRDERINLNNPQQQGQPGYFLANAEAGNIRVSGLFRRLIADDQYVVHPSGLWIMLRAPLRADEQLAISYITESGDTIGAINAELTPAGDSTPRLRLLRGAVSTHQPGAATWDYEMHQVYRLDSSNNVELNSIELKLSLGELSGGSTFKDVNGVPLTFLRLFGLDEDAPVDQLDMAQIYQPGRDAFGSSTGSAGRSGVAGTYVIFSTLEPFARPGPVPSARLSAAQAAAVLGTDANAAIYDNPDPVTRESAGRYRLNFKYRLKVEGLMESFNLGAFGIREGSERLFLGEKALQSGVDYTIDYEIGTVTLNDAQSLFASNPEGQIRATWEQKSLFQIAPTSVFGLNARAALGRRGELNFVGLYQSEGSIISRPQVGVEPGSVVLGGVSGRLDLGGYALDRMLSNIPGLRLGAPSAVTLSGELALSVPNPNTRGEAYLDDFEATDELPLPTHRRQWKLGSRPETNEHATAELPMVLDAASAINLVWQHDILQNGNVTGTFFPREIDRQIVIAGNELPEPVLWLTFGDSTPNTVGRRWRSMTTVLSTTGRDLSRSEYLEFYMWSSAVRGQTLVIDIGQLSEDAFYFDEDEQTTGTYPNGERWGLAILDQEANLARREVWGTDKDERGLWNRTCEANLQQQYAQGDPDANCARKNGEPDSEDLDGNGFLDGNDQAHFRFVIPLDDSPANPFLVRDTSATHTRFRLFRVPLRTAGRGVNGATDATWRFIKHLRMTVASPMVNAANAPVLFENYVLARMRVTGSRWTKRDINGIMQGPLTDVPAAGATADMLQVGPVSLLNDSDYAPPAGVTNELQDPSTRFGSSGVEFNEKALRLDYQRLAPGQRAEVYFRYPQQSRGFLAYRQLRLWALPRSGNWGPAGDLRFQVRVGNDARNYYLYQSRLTPPITGPVNPADWLPQIVVEFDRWFELREQATLLLESGAAPPGQPVVLWSADSAYAVVLEDRARAPNLSATRELSFAVFNAGNTTALGQVWIDDMRLSGAFRDPGMAGSFTMDVRGGDFLNASITYANQSAVFRQLNQDARYLSTGEVSVTSTAQLGQLTPGGWGLDLPLSVTHTRSGQDPLFLENSDVRAQNLTGLRESGADATRVSLSLRKRTPSANPIVGVLIDGLALRVGYNKADNSTVTTRAQANGFDGGISYARDLAPRTVPAVPGLLQGLLRALAPARMEESDFFKRLAGSRLRWTPERIVMGSAYYKQERRSFQYDRVLELDNDSTRSIESPRHGLENDASISFLPFEALRATISLRSSRDLLATDRASNQTLERNAIAAARSRLSGIDIGWETQRSLSSELSFRPEIAPWLRPAFNYSARFGTDRHPSYLEARPDSTALMQRRFQAERSLNRALLFEPAGLLRALYALPEQGTDSLLAARAALTRWTYALANTLRPIELNWNASLGSQFERELSQPGLAYQVGLGGFDAYRLIGGDTAVFVNARSAFTARSALRLPLNAELDATFEENTIDAVDQRGGNRQQVDRRWPQLHLNWSRLPLPAFLDPIIVTGTLRAGIENSRQHSLLGGFSDQERGGRETRIPVGLVVGFANGFSAQYTGALSTGTSTDPTGDAEQSGSDHTLQLGGLFQPPESWRERLNGPITLNLTLKQTSQRNCRFQSILVVAEEATSCIRFIDFRNRTANLVVESTVRDLRVGLQMSYSSRQSFVGTHNGTSQFQIGLFGNFEMKAGRALQPAGLR